MATGTMTQRAAISSAEKQFPGNDIKIMPLKGNGSITEALGRFRAGEIASEDIPSIQAKNRKFLASMRKDYQENAFDRNNPQELKAYSDLLVAASETKESAKELSDYRKFELTNDVLASPWALVAFQMVNLNPDEMVLIERPRSLNFQHFTVYSIGQNGGVRQDRWRTTKSAEQIEMEYLATDRVQYPIMDLQQGDVSQADAVNWKLRYDMEMQIDQLAKMNIDGSKVASGLRDTLSIHPLVDVDNIPDTNYLNLDTGAFTGAKGRLTITKLKQILLHVAMFGAAGGADEPIAINTIMMSPQNLRDPWDFVDLVSGFSGGDEIEPSQTVTSGVREQIFSTGMMTSAWGHTFSWTPNSQLPLGKMYIITSQPIGWMFTKTAYDRVLTWDETNSADHADQNEAEVVYKKTAKFVVPDLWRHRIVIVDLDDDLDV